MERQQSLGGGGGRGGLEGERHVDGRHGNEAWWVLQREVCPERVVDDTPAEVPDAEIREPEVLDVLDQRTIRQEDDEVILQRFQYEELTLQDVLVAVCEVVEVEDVLEGSLGVSYESICSYRPLVGLGGDEQQSGNYEEGIHVQEALLDVDALEEDTGGGQGSLVEAVAAPDLVQELHEEHS